MPPSSQIGATLEALSATIAARRNAGDESYTHRLLTDTPDAVLKKVMEESGEVALAAKDVESWACSSMAAALAYRSGCGEDAGDAGEANEAGGAGGVGGSDVDGSGKVELAVELPEEYHEAVDHLRYEAADVVYHLLVVLERYGIGIDEFAAELNNRMRDDERPAGGIRLYDEYVKRGK